MPPSTSSISMFQRQGVYFRQRLTKLYSDAKQSYESASVAPTSVNNDQDPAFSDLRRDFQIQKDRLLAWGMLWADTNTAQAQYQGSGDVDIDKKLDQAGLGDTVASIMSEIQRLLSESGKLQHPERYLSLGKGQKSPQSPKHVRKEWSDHELVTSRALLDQLTTCIDVLYSLSEANGMISPSDKESKVTKHDFSSPMVPASPLSEDPATAISSAPESQAAVIPSLVPYGHLYDDPRYVVMSSLHLRELPIHSTLDPPPYDEVTAIAHRKVIGFLGLANRPVIGDSSALPKSELAARLDVERVDEMDRVSTAMSGWPISHNGHPKLLGYSIDTETNRLVWLYELPCASMEDSVACRTISLTSAISASFASIETSSPALEDRFRLAYNLVLSLLGLMMHGQCHRSLNSGNIMFLHTHNGVSEYRSVRLPYLFPSTQNYLQGDDEREPPTSSIYRHPDEASSCPKPSHQIYSLGLLLLEIGLWMPLSKLWKSTYDRSHFRSKVRNVYTMKLGSKCGSLYMRTVQTCLDSEGETGHDPMSNAVDTLLKVAKDLASCCVIDVDGPSTAGDLDFLRGLDEERRAATQVQPILPTDENLSAEQKKLRKWTNVDIPQSKLDEWNTVLMPRLGKLLQDILRGSLESSSVSLMMVGPAPEQSKATICIECWDTERVREALRRRFRLKRGWGLVVLRGKVRRSGKARRRQKKASNGEAGRPTRLQQQLYQERPGHGASIGAFKDNEHLPPVSFGGAILVDGEAYGMTVHHMLDAPSEDEEGEEKEGVDWRREEEKDGEGEIVRRAMAPQRSPELFHGLEGPSAGYDHDSELELSDDESDASTIRPDYAAFDADGNEFWILEDPPELAEDSGSDSDSDADETASIGDKAGIDPLDDDDILVTQPAIDDVDEDFFPDPADRDEDHLDSHSFGYVHASSGIRRVVSDEVKHEVDWCLIKMHEQRRSLNMISTGMNKSRRAKGNDGVHLLDIMQTKELAGTEVHCCGRSSGIGKGRISNAMALVKMHGRQSFSSSWCLEGGFGIPGDSGAWIYDPITRKLCGQVLAWGNKSQTAYIAPMEVLFKDIRETLGAESVCLPGSDQMTEPNVRLQNSKDIELALEGFRLRAEKGKMIARDFKPLPPIPPRDELLEKQTMKGLLV